MHKRTDVCDEDRCTGTEASEQGALPNDARSSGESKPHRQSSPDLEGEFPSLPDWMLSPSNALPAVLAWKPSSKRSEADNVKRMSGRHAFSKMLGLAEICELGVVPVPGAAIVYPWGVALLERFASIVRAHYGRALVQEFAYPSVIPSSWLTSLDHAVDVASSVLRVKTAADTEMTRDRGSLTPTGEPVFYNHWRSMLKRGAALPIRAFQRATYFRPVTSADRSGAGVYRALESPDVFEFHCCHATAGVAEKDLHFIWDALLEVGKVISATTIPVRRPPWGNREGLYEWALAADAPLPSGESAQVMAAYFQGTKLSSRIGLTVRIEGALHNTCQIDGYVSRRLLFATLEQLLRPNGQICIPPNLAPIQVVFICRCSSVEDLESARSAADSLTSKGLRVSVEECAGSKDVRLAQRKWDLRGVPLVVLVFGRRNEAAEEVIRVVLVRHDEDAELVMSDLSQLDAIASQALDEIATSLRVRSERRALDRTRFARTSDEAQAALRERRIAVAPLIPTAAHVSTVGNWKMGEVLGFATAPAMERCILSHQYTNVRAVIASRL